MQSKNDRRSQRTRLALGDALVALMMERGYDAISIKDIIDHANVGRSTFYSHFADKDELFASQMERVVSVLSQHIPQNLSEGNPFFPSLGLFQHIQEQWKLYKILSWDSGVEVLTRSLQKSLSEVIEQRLSSNGQTYEVPIPVIANFLSGSFLSLVKWWLDNKMIYSPEQMDEMFRRLALSGMAQWTTSGLIFEEN
ncbi:MAG TPA: TetR/AcrR family transcriptional regulator [Anaerolineales bacterium]|nr:TetR/AcrR family transcriptional regulator [Anaerolineales bacterium]